METNPNAVRAVPCAISLEQLSDEELLIGTRRLVGRSNQLLAELIAHLGEVEARGIHRTRACSSLYTYCIYELRFSEDEAFRRVAAARLVRRFPALLDALVAGELHLTGLLLLGPHLTESNLVEVLNRAKHRTKREILRLVRVLDPLPTVPARIEPLGPAPARSVPAAPSWEDFVQATCPIRELAPGERPRDWTPVEDVQDVGALDDHGGTVVQGRMVATASTVPARVDWTTFAPDAAPARVDSRPFARDTAPARVGAVIHEPLAPQRYKVQFTATEEYVCLVDEANALLSHAAPKLTLEELQLRAMRALVAALTKKKYASPDHSPSVCRFTEQGAASGQAIEPGSSREQRAEQAGQRAEQAGQRTEQVSSTGQRGAGTNPCRRGRHIPTAVRRAVFEREGNRCSYVAATGTRCRETHRLEFHHVEPFAAGGEHTASNLTLRCRAHNDLAAEADFGRESMNDKKTRAEHVPFRESEEIVNRARSKLDGSTSR
jgi:hypothetical protein